MMRRLCDGSTVADEIEFDGDLRQYKKATEEVEE